MWTAVAEEVVVMSGSSENQKNDGKVVDLNLFKQKKELSRELAPGRKPLYLDQKSGTIHREPSSAPTDSEGSNFGERLQRIRSSLDRIHSLMTELKGLSSKDQKN
jgi:hypothetical protein